MTTEKNQYKKNDRQFFKCNFCSISVGLICIFLIVLLVLIFTFLSASIASHIYDSQHAISNPVERGDDLGSGLFVIFWALMFLIFSIPFSFLIFKFLYKYFSKLLECK